MKHNRINRRRLLRGMLQGSAVGVGLPMLDLFLNNNGTALADGSRLPVCFGTWFWGLGLSPGMWEPKETGKNYTLTPQLEPLAPIIDKINIYSDMEVFLDGKQNLAHVSTIQGIMTGHVSAYKEGYSRSIDELVADKLKVRNRFRSITVSADGDPGASFSARGGTGINPAEVSPVTLYKRIFGVGFQDPNSTEFTPDPAVMLRKSALSAVTEERQLLMKEVGGNDRNRLDEFFTSLRDLEQKLALELEKPEPMPACSLPDTPKGEKPNLAIDRVVETHSLFTGLLTHALACGQTRIFNVVLSSNVVKAGDPTSYHTYTHQETDDPELGYQPMCYWFARHYLEAFRDIVIELDSIKEGDGTLLDRILLMACTEHGFAKWHSLKGIPLFTAGRAGGGMNTGYHVAANGDTASRVGFTCQKALGLSVKSWGTGSNESKEPFSEVLG